MTVTFAHIAFWDRFTLARWHRLIDRGIHPIRVPDLLDLMNETALPEWMALRKDEASRQAIEAAQAVDELISSADIALTEEMVRTGFDGMPLSSTRQRNVSFEDSGRGEIAQGLAWSRVESSRDRIEFFLGRE
jgi:hypothetical protein